MLKHKGVESVHMCEIDEVLIGLGTYTLSNICSERHRKELHTRAGHISTFMEK